MILLRDFEPGDAGWLLMRHGEHYARSDGFDHRFEADVAGLLAAFLSRPDREAERGWIAARDAERLGSILLTADSEETARVRCFFVVEEMRGSGLAQRLLRTSIDAATAAGYRILRVNTHESHLAAGRLYARSGLRMLAHWPVRRYGQDLVEQLWELPLPGPADACNSRDRAIHPRNGPP